MQEEQFSDELGRNSYIEVIASAIQNQIYRRLPVYEKGCDRNVCADSTLD